MAKTIPTVKIHNVETGEIIERDMTAEEILEVEAKAKIDAQFKSEAEAKFEAKLQAEAKLAKLGLTAQDLRALGL